MTVEEAVWARVANLSAVEAIVSTRVYLDKTPQDPTYPLVLVYLASDNHDQHLRGPRGLAFARVTVEGRAHEESGQDTYEVTALYEAFDGDGKGPTASGLFGWQGVVGSPGLEILNASHRDARRRFYDSDEQRVLRMMQDYWVSYRHE